MFNTWITRRKGCVTRYWVTYAREWAYEEVVSEMTGMVNRPIMGKVNLCDLYTLGDLDCSIACPHYSSESCPILEE